jgi:hypothetical protein
MIVYTYYNSFILSTSDGADKITFFAPAIMRI